MSAPRKNPAPAASRAGRAGPSLTARPACLDDKDGTAGWRWDAPDVEFGWRPGHDDKADEDPQTRSR